jgi:hypothetical protein
LGIGGIEMMGLGSWQYQVAKWYLVSLGSWQYQVAKWYLVSLGSWQCQVAKWYLVSFHVGLLFTAHHRIS